MQVSNTMATKIALDTVSSANSLKGLANAVQATTSAWKAQEIAMKSSGDIAGSLEAKYKGLGDSIERQKAKITELVSRQQGMDTSTKAGAESFLKLQKDIDSANRQLSSFEAQQNKAKTSMGYYTSGLADLQRGYQNATNYSRSYVERLEAEGRGAEANKAKLSGLKSSMSNLTEQYAKQRTEAINMARELGTSSDAYVKQKTRLNETATAMAKAKTESKELETQIAKDVPMTWTQKLKTNLMGVGKETESANKKMGIFHGTMLGAFAGNAIFSGVMTLGSKLKEAAKDGLELAEQGEQTKRVWKDLGLSDKATDSMVSSMVKLRSESGYSAGSIKQLQKQMYGLTGSSSAAEKLATSIVAMGVASGETEQKATKMGGSMARMFSSDKVTSSQFAKLEKQMPALSGAMSKAAGVSKESFQSMIDDGKVSGKQFQDLVAKVSKDSPKMFSSFAKTGEGSFARIKSGWTSMKSNMMAPIVDVKGSGLSELSKAMNSKEMTKASKDIGNGLSSAAKGLASFVEYGAKHSKDLLGIAGAIGSITKSLAIGVWKAISGAINSVANAFNKVSGNSKASKDPIKSVNTALSGIAKHKKAIENIGKVLIAAFAGKKALNGVLGLTRNVVKLSEGIKGIHTAKALGDLKELHGVTKGMAAMKLGIKWTGAKTLSGIKKSGKGIAGAFKWTAKLSKSAATRSLSVLKKGVTSAGPIIKKGLKFTASVATKAATLALTGLKKTVSLVSGGFKALKLAMMSNPFVAVAVAVIAIGTALYELYKHNKKFRNFVNGLAKDAKKIIGNIVKFFVGLGKSISKEFGKLGGFAKKGWNGVSKAVSGGSKSVGKTWDKYNKARQKADKLMYDTVKKTASKGWDGVKGVTNSGIRNVEKIWNNLHSATGKIAKEMMREHPKTFKAGYKVMQDQSDTWKDITNSHWNRLGADTKRTLKDMTKFWKNLFGESYDFLNKITGGRLGDMLKTFQNIGKSISKTWSDMWNGMRQVFNDIWNSIKNLGKDGMNGVIGFINGGIGGIDTVIHTFGGSKSAIPKIAKLATGTMSGRLPQDTLAVLNDGNDSPQTDNREMVQKSDGRSYLVKGRNTLMKLDAGDAVFSASQTREMLKGIVPHFSTGSFLNGIGNAAKGAVDWAGDKLGDVGAYLGDKMEAIKKFINDPTKAVNGVFDKAIGSLAGKAEFIAKMVPSEGHWMIGQGEKWFKNLFKSLQGSVDNPGGSGVERWKPIIESVAQRMNTSLGGSGMNAMLKRIRQESNGDPNITNNWDSNAKAGHPSTGLLQYIQPTFDHWLPKGFTNNIHNGSSQIAAAFNDSNWLRDISVKGGWGPTGHKMMANGGEVLSHQMVEMAEHNKPEMVIPLDMNKRSRATQLLAQVMGRFAGDSGINIDNSDNDLSKQLESLNEKFDSMLSMFGQLLGLTAAQTQAVKDGSFSKDALYKQQARDQQLHTFQTY